MNSESESPLGDAESAVEGSESQNASAEAPSVGEARLDRTAAIDRIASRLLEHWGSILLTASVAAAVGLAACLFVLQYRPDRQLDFVMFLDAVPGETRARFAGEETFCGSADRPRGFNE